MVDEYCEKLSNEKSETFYKIVVNMLFATERAHPNTGAAISYLVTRVRDIDQSNCLKMVRLFKYVRGTKTTPLIPSADKSGILKWYIDESYTVHPNTRDNNGVVLTMGQVLPILTLSKQKLNIRSSTKSKFVGVDKLMPLVICTSGFFFECKGYGVTENIIHQ